MRSTSIDALRGIAILGILFMNIPFHANMLLGYVPFESMLSSDKLITLLYSIFADGRFRTLFCLLFGAGLAIQYESCIRKGIDTTIFLKSILAMMVANAIPTNPNCRTKSILNPKLTANSKPATSMMVLVFFRPINSVCGKTKRLTTSSR